MTPREVDATVLLSTLVVSGILGGLWFELVRGLPALGVTFVTSVGLGLLSLRVYRWRLEQEDDRDDRE